MGTERGERKLGVVPLLAIIVAMYAVGYLHATPKVWGEIELETACEALDKDAKP